jgi:hypothetical protein
MMQRTCASAAFGCRVCENRKARAVAYKALNLFTIVIVNGNKKGRENGLPSSFEQLASVDLEAPKLSIWRAYFADAL